MKTVKLTVLESYTLPKITLKMLPPMTGATQIQP